MKSLFCFAIAVLSSLLACSPAPRGRVAETLDEVAGYVCERPDSALTVLQAIDSTVLKTRALRAKYSLLHVMALDKSYKDISAPGLLDPAVTWYERHGTADEKLKTFFYEGRIAQVNKDWNGAAVFYSQAEAFSEKAQDAHAVGLLYEAISSVYNATHNTDKEQEYVEKALSVYKQAQDPIYGSALGDLAIVYQTRHEWEKADSLYQEAIAQSGAYPHSLAIYLSNYARMKVLQPNADPAGAIALLNRKQTLSGALTPMEAGTYAYALLLTGKEKEANDLANQLERSQVSQSPEVEYWLCRIAYAGGDYKRAYELMNKSRQWEESEIRSLLSDSVSEAISDYQADIARGQRERYKTHLAVFIIILLLLALALALSALRRNKIVAERDRIMDICAELEKEAAEQEAQTASLLKQLNRFRDEVGKERILRFRQAGKIRSSIWRLDHLGPVGWIENDSKMKEIKNELSYIYDMDDSGEKMIRRLDKELDGNLLPLFEKLNLQDKPDDKLFLCCCCFLELPSDVLVAKFKLTPGNIRVKKYRLRAQIAQLNNPDYNALFGINNKNVTN